MNAQQTATIVAIRPLFAATPSSPDSETGGYTVTVEHEGVYIGEERHARTLPDALAMGHNRVVAYGLGEDPRYLVEWLPAIYEDENGEPMEVRPDGV